MGRGADNRLTFFSSRSLAEIKFALGVTQSHYNLLFKSQPMQNALLVSLQSLVDWSPQIFYKQTSFQLALLGTFVDVLSGGVSGVPAQPWDSFEVPWPGSASGHSPLSHHRGPSPQCCHFDTLHQFVLRAFFAFCT